MFMASKYTASSAITVSAPPSRFIRDTFRYPATSAPSPKLRGGTLDPGAYKAEFPPANSAKNATPAQAVEVVVE